MGRDKTLDGYLPLEVAAITELLAGPDPILGELRLQFEASSAGQREWTGVGFWLAITTPPDTVPLPLEKDLYLSDVGAELEGVEHGVGFVLHVFDGLLGQLEGFTYDQPWPDWTGAFVVAYIRDGKLSPERSEMDPL